MDKDFYKYKRLLDARKVRDEEHHKKLSRERLSKIVAWKLRTTFIGDLFEFEQEFGHLWGMNSSDPTPEQQKMAMAWQRVRTRILDKGNDHIKDFKKQIKDYSIDWKRYKVNLPVRKVYDEQ